MKKSYTLLFFLSIVLFNGSLSLAQTCTTSVTDISGTSTICNGANTTLTATHNGDEVYWYNAATDGTLLFTGNPYTTAALTATTSFWAESKKQVLGTATTGGAKLTPTSTSGTTVNTGTAPWGLVFNATQSFVLNSVDVFLSSTTPGTLVIDLKNSNQEILQSWNISTPAGGSGSAPVQFTVPLNYTVPVGNGYRLLAVSSPSMVRDLSSNSFPYFLGNVGSVAQGTINNSLTSNPGVYYFFYNWNYTPIVKCVSTREEFTVTVNTTPAPTGDSQQLFTSGDTIDDLVVSGNDLIWYSDSAGTNPIPTSTVLEEGTTYYVSQTLNGCESTLLAVTAVTTLNVNNIVFAGLNYYPNPVKDVFTLSNLDDKAQIVVYTVLGQPMFSNSYETSEVQLDFSAFSTGIYIVKITAQNESKTIKVLKK